MCFFFKMKGSMEPKLGKEAVLDLTKDHKLGDDGRISIYKVQFLVDPNFGVPGVVTVVNCYDREFFLESISIVQDSNVHFTCKSWVQSNKLDPDKRRFFIDKVTSYMVESIQLSFAEIMWSWVWFGRN